MQRILTASVAGVFLLWPVQFLALPLNMSLADLFGFVVLPLCWVLLVHARRRPVWPLLAPMWAILATTCGAVWLSLDPSESVTPLIKEIYLYFWCATICTTFAHSDARARRWMLIAWCAAAYINGALIAAQFVSPSLLASMNAMVAGVGTLDLYRPSGLMENSNAAALFQLTAFVPLVALRLSRPRLLVLAAGLLLTVLGTGSMGAVVALAAAVVTGLLGMGVLLRDWRRVLQLSVAMVLAASLIAVVIMVLMETVPSIDERIRYVLTGRSEGSAAGRFELWSLGIDMFLAELRPCGIGPDQFKTFGGLGLHNDVLAFVIERGPLALFALLMFAAMATAHAVELARRGRSGEDPGQLIFLAALVALAVFSLTHEIFHQRPPWMVLALQEALWWRGRVGATAGRDAAESGAVSQGA